MVLTPLDPDNHFVHVAVEVIVTRGESDRQSYAARSGAGINDHRIGLDALVGGVEHRVALIGFDSAPHLLTPFTPDTAIASRQLANLRKGDSGGAILDGAAFAVEQLRAQPARYRRAVLLLSETIDHGSKITLGHALRLFSDTNTSMYSFAFSSTTTAIVDT